MSKLGDITVNGADCFRGQLVQPWNGIWVADVTMDADTVPTGAATLSLMGRDFVGTVVHAPNDDSLSLSGDSGGIKRLRIVAGAGGLYTTLEPKSYDQGALVSQVLADLLGAGGETQAADIDATLLGQLLPQWSWTGGTLLGALQHLASSLGAALRARDNGTIWLGVPTQTTVTAPEYVLIDIAPEAGQAVWGLDDSSVSPGQTIDGLPVQQVVFEWEPGQLRAVLTFAPGPVHSLFQLFGVWLRRAGFDFVRSQPGRFNSQQGATAEVQPDDTETLSPYRRTALRYGLPDTQCTITAGARLAMHFEAGTPQFPALLNFAPSPSSTASKIKIGVSSVGPPAGTQPLVTRAMRTAQQTLDTNLSVDFAAAGIALNGAGVDATFAAAFPAAAAFLVTAGQAFGLATGAAKHINDYETSAAANSNFLTTILEGG